MNYYVVQEMRGITVAYGPYKTESARDRRYDTVEGGELHKFNTFESDKDRAILEFKDEGAQNL